MNVSEALIREIVTKVLEESAGKGSKPEFEKHIDPSGIIGIKTSTVKCEPFQQDGVKLKDVVTLEEAPHGLRHHGAGSHQLRVDPSPMMSTTWFWTARWRSRSTAVWCPEAPATSSISPREATFTSRPPNRTRYAYFVYPADWQ